MGNMGSPSSFMVAWTFTSNIATELFCWCSPVSTILCLIIWINITAKSAFTPPISILMSMTLAITNLFLPVYPTPSFKAFFKKYYWRTWRAVYPTRKESDFSFPNYEQLRTFLISLDRTGLIFYWEKVSRSDFELRNRFLQLVCAEKGWVRIWDWSCWVRNRTSFVDGRCRS